MVLYMIVCMMIIHLGTNPNRGGIPPIDRRFNIKVGVNCGSIW